MCLNHVLCPHLSRLCLVMWRTVLLLHFGIHHLSLKSTSVTKRWMQLWTQVPHSAVRTNMISDVMQRSQRVQPWTLPPIQLANSASCSPTGIAWLNIGLQGQSFYHRFVIIPDLSSPLILGMDFYAACIS